MTDDTKKTTSANSADDIPFLPSSGAKKEAPEPDKKERDKKTVTANHKGAADKKIRTALAAMNSLMERLKGRTPKSPAEARVGNGTHLFLSLCIVLVVVFFGWAAFGELDIVSNATGEVIPSSKVKRIQHLEGGIISKILVREGDAVTKDQPVVELEATKSSAERDEVQARLSAVKVDILRLTAEIEGSQAPKFDADLVKENPELVKKALERFAVRRNRHLAARAAQEQLVSQKKQEIKEVEARIRNVEKSLAIVNEQIGISAKLLKKQLTNRMVHLNLVKEATELGRRIEEDTLMLPRLTSAAEEAELKLASLDSEFQEEARRERSELERTYKEFSERLKKFEDSLARTTLRTPVDGVVKTLYVNTEGGVVSPGGTVMDIVPQDDQLVVEAKLLPQDIGYVQPGQTAMVKLASSDAVRFGNLPGKVVQVSPDTLVTEDQQAYYRVRIVTEKDHFRSGDLRYNLFPGMQLLCSIQTGKRTVLTYLLEPFIGTAGDALRER